MAAKLLGTAPAAANDAVPKSYVDAIPGIKAVTTLTGSATATANTLHVINLATSLGALTITLPAAPAQGTVCGFIRQDLNNFTSQIVVAPGGSDTLSNAAGSYALTGSGVGIKFLYVGTAWWIVDNTIGPMPGYWGVRSTYTAGFNPSVMARDGAGRAQVNDPSAATDIANKQYVDAVLAPQLFTAVTATGTLNSDVSHLVNVPSSPTTVTLTLPTAPANATIVELFRIDSFLSVTVNISPGGTDTIAEASPWVLKPFMGVRFIYRTSTTTWHVEGSILGGISGLSGPVSAATASTMMSRDSSGRAQVVAPSASGDIATKGYVDGAVRIVTTNTSANVRDTIFASAASGTITITCPVVPGSRVMVKRTDSSANQVIVVGTSGNVDGDASAILTGLNASAVFVGDGTNLLIEAVYEAGVTITPAGVIEMYGGASAPAGYLLCDGSAVSRTTYANLFAAIGTTYGVGDGSTTFNLPSFLNKFARGNSPGVGSGADTHTHPLSAAGRADISFDGSNFYMKQSSIGTWTSTKNKPVANSTAAGGTGINDGAALDGATDSASNVPVYTGVAYIIKT